MERAIVLAILSVSTHALFSARRPIADELRTLLREGSLWTQNDLDINRLLTRFLAGLRFVVRNGQIVGLIPDPRPPVGRKRKA